VSYSFDVFAYSPRKGAIGIEIDGVKGHNTKVQTARDKRRDEDIIRACPSIRRIYRFILSGLKIATDQEIEEDLEINE